jgi:hypothetical protein
MSDRIKSNDVIDDELFIKVSQNSEAFIKNLTIVEAGLKAILIEAQKVMATTVFANSADIEKYADAVLKVAKAQEVLAKAEGIREKNHATTLKNDKEGVKVAQEKEKLAQQELKTKTAVNKETERSEKAKAKEAKSQAALTSEYKQATAALNAMEKELLDNAIAGRADTEANKKLMESHKELRARIVEAEQSIGRFQRNVGNYKSGFDGLGNSINQLTREMPAFANSVQTGFMALSNNLPIFFDEIKRARQAIKDLRAEGQQAPSLFSQLTSAVFSWGTALSVGVTLLTVYGKEIVTFIGTLFTLNDAYKISGEEQSKYYNKLRGLIEDQLQAQIKLNVANGTWTEQQSKEFQLEYDKKQKLLALETEYQKEMKGIFEKYLGSQDLLDNPAERTKKIEAYGKAYEAATVRHNELKSRLEKANAAELALIEEEARKEREKKEKEAADKAAAEHEKRIKDQDDRAIAAMEALEEKREKARQIMRDHSHNADVTDSDGTVWWNKEEGITLEQHNIDLENIDKTKKKAEDDRKKEAEERRKEAKEQFDLAVSFIDQLNRIKSDKVERQLSDEISMRSRNIQQQQQLAAQGLDNTLAFEKEAMAKAELQRQQQIRKRERDAKTLAFLKLISSFADKGDDQAVTKAFLQMAIATALTGSFAEGVENLEGPGTETSDSILARLSKGESVATAKATKSDPGLVTAMNKGKVDEYFEKEYLPKYMTSQDVGSFGENMINSLMLQQITALNKKIESFEKVVKERPVHQTDLTPLGDIVDTRIANGMKRVTTKKSNSPLNWI